MTNAPNPYAHLGEQSSDVLSDDWGGVAFALQDWLLANYGIRQNPRAQVGDLLARLQRHGYVVVTPGRVALNETSDTYLDTKRDPATSITPRPRRLTAMDLEGVICSRCDDPVVSGTLVWRDEGPYQLISVRTFWCRQGHVSVRQTDGG